MFSVRIYVQYNYSADKTTFSAHEVLHKFVKWTGRIGHFHDGVILLLGPESVGFLLSCAN